MVNDIVVPTHPFAEGVTTKVATSIPVPRLVALKEGIFPDPAAAIPIDGIVFVHV